MKELGLVGWKQEAPKIGIIGQAKSAAVEIHSFFIGFHLVTLYFLPTNFSVHPFRHYQPAWPNFPLPVDGQTKGPSGKEASAVCAALLLEDATTFSGLKDILSRATPLIHHLLGSLDLANHKIRLNFEVINKASPPHNYVVLMDKAVNWPHNKRFFKIP